MQEAKDTALKIINESRVGTMATMENNKPHTRYMTFFNDGFTLYTPTSRKTQKVDEVDANPYTHILLGYEGEGYGDEYVAIEGVVTKADDESLKKRMWHEQMSMYFDGPDDPDLLLLKVEPTEILVMNKKGQEPAQVELNSGS